MPASKIKIPSLGENIESAVIACWHFNVGDQINQGDDMVELVTDKASFNLPAEGSGRLSQVFKKQGDEISIGSVIGEIDGE